MWMDFIGRKMENNIEVYKTVLISLMNIAVVKC